MHSIICKKVAEMNTTTASKSKKNVTLFDDILLTFLITYVFAAYSYEQRFSAEFTSLLEKCMLIIFIITWMITAVKNGMNKKTGFALYSAAYWLVPQLIIILFNSGPELFRHSVFVYTLSEFSLVLSTRPAVLTGKYIGVTAEMALLLILMIIFAAFFGGLAYANDKQSNKKSICN